MEHKHHEEPVEEREIRLWKRRLWGAWVFAIPIALLMILERFFGVMLFGELSPLLLLILGFPVIFIFGFDTIRGGVRGFISFYFNMDSLISLGTVIAYITGIFSFTGFIQDYSPVRTIAKI